MSIYTVSKVSCDRCSDECQVLDKGVAPIKSNFSLHSSMLEVAAAVRIDPNRKPLGMRRHLCRKCFKAELIQLVEGMEG